MYGQCTMTVLNFINVFVLFRSFLWLLDLPTNFRCRTGDLQKEFQPSKTLYPMAYDMQKAF